MGPSTSALVVAVVGVTGTLASGLMAHRSALRSKSAELDHAERQRRDEQLVVERRETLSERRASCAALNQRLRQFHSLLSRHYLALASEHASTQQGQDREESRRILRGSRIPCVQVTRSGEPRDRPN